MAEPNNYITATRKNFVSNDNEGRMVEKCIVEIQGTFLVKIRDYAFNGNIGENAFKHIDKCLKVLNNDIAKGIEEPWSENGVPYQLCDHICEPYHFKNGETKWPTCTSDVDGFCNGGELPGMVRVGSMTYFQDHRWYDELADGKLKDETLALKAKIEGSWGDTTPGVMKFCKWLKNSFENFHEIDYNVLVTLQECWWKVNAYEIALFTRMKNFRQGPYANMETEWTSNAYLDVNRISGRDYEASNVSDTQENQGHEEQKRNPNPEPSNCKIRRFEMMKYSFDDDKDYITIKESEYLNHSKDSLDAYR
ncbi:hypothetical protein Tco_1180854 [Tanacetum coccineum]